MKIIGHELGQKQLLNLFILVILIAGIVLGVYLTLTQQIFKSSASTGDVTNIEFTGSNISSDQANSRNIQIKLHYVPAPGSTSPMFPTSFKLANSQMDFVNSQEQTFDQNDKIVNWTLTSGNGVKTVYVQFLVNNTWSDPVFASITLNEPPLQPTFEIGVNIPSITDYGYNDLRPYAPNSDIDADLKELSSFNGKIVRVFAANDKISDDEASKRLGDFLSDAQKYNISVIVSLIDFYSSGHNPQGTDSYYTGSYNGTSLLGDNFFTSGYKGVYKTFVQKIVSDNKNHSNIYAWEPGNELKDDSSPQTFISFMQDITSVIKGIDNIHPVATGMLNAAHADLSPGQLYPNLPDVDIITIHPYGTSHDGSSDVAWAIQNYKQAIVEETGIAGTGDRSSDLQSAITYWRSQGASALLNWGFIAKGLGDNGDGDRQYGMDTIWHGADYEKYANIFMSTSPTLPTPSPTSTPQPAKPSPTQSSQGNNQPQTNPTSGNHGQTGVVNNQASPQPSPTGIIVATSKPLPISTPTPLSSPVTSKFDFNNDGKVNSVDVAIFIKNWVSGSTDKNLDFNSDGVVNAVDFGILVKNLNP